MGGPGSGRKKHMYTISGLTTKGATKGMMFHENVKPGFLKMAIKVQKQSYGIKKGSLFVQRITKVNGKIIRTNGLTNRAWNNRK